MIPEQERAFIEWRTNHDPRKYPAERDAFMAGWDAGRAALQSQDREKHLVAAIREAIELLGPEAPLCSGCEYEWNHALRVLRESIDHARRVEGGGE